jgi:REP element-mobilizing transposase RayT
METKKVQLSRKINRLKGYDYSSLGSYFITICTKERQEILCKIVGDAAFGVPNVELTEIGEKVKERIDSLTTNPNIRLETYVIMPNHVHLLITITDGTPRAAPPTKTTISQTVNALKSLTTKQLGYSIWQRSYHDHIIRSEKDFSFIAEYIDNNPMTWEKDTLCLSKYK